MHSLLALGLLLAPVQQFDLSVGPKILADMPHLYVTPGYHLHTKNFQLGLQAPFRLSLSESQVRPNDIDDLSDYGRIVRYVQLSEHVRVGDVSNLSDEYRLVFDHYFNQIDDDRHRTAVLIDAKSDQYPSIIFADQILGTPIVGVLTAWAPTSRLQVYASAALDTRHPNVSAMDDEGVFGAAALTASIRALQMNRFKLQTYVSLAQTHTHGTGGHFGIDMLWPYLSGWKLRLRTEGMLFSEGYDWAPFDLLYLVRRVRNAATLDGASRQGFGGRLHAKLERKSISIGAETAGAIGSPQQINTFWIEIPSEPFRLFGVLHAGRHDVRRHPFNSQNLSAAVSAQLTLSDHWMIETTCTHVQRQDNAQYRGFIEAGIFTNWRVAFR